MSKESTSKASKSCVAHWTADMEKLLCDLLAEQIYIGNKPNSFTKTAWAHVREELNKTTGKCLSMEQIKNRYNLLRIRYKDFKIILGVPGFVWDPVGKNVLATEGVWENYLKDYPDHRKYKTMGLPIYEELCVLFGEAGKYGRASTQFSLPDYVGNHASKSNVEVDESPTPIPTPTQDSSAFALEEDFGEGYIRKSDEGCKRRSSTMHEHLRSSKESRSSELSEVLFAIADATKSRDVVIDPKADPYSIPNCIKHLQTLEGVSTASFMAALVKFQELGWRQTFMSLQINFQKEWLKSLEP